MKNTWVPPGFSTNVEVVVEVVAAAAAVAHSLDAGLGVRVVGAAAAWGGEAVVAVGCL